MSPPGFRGRGTCSPLRRILGRTVRPSFDCTWSMDGLAPGRLPEARIAGCRKIVIVHDARLASSDEVFVEAGFTIVFLDQKTGRPAPLSDEVRRAWLERSTSRRAWGLQGSDARPVSYGRGET